MPAGTSSREAVADGSSAAVTMAATAGAGGAGAAPAAGAYGVGAGAGAPPGLSTHSPAAVQICFASHAGLHDDTHWPELQTYPDRHAGTHALAGDAVGWAWARAFAATDRNAAVTTTMTTRRCTWPLMTDSSLGCSLIASCRPR